MSGHDSTSYSILLTGLDGTNPLGFLAALGALVVAHQAGESGACLRWARARTWTPALDGLTTDKRTELSNLFVEGLIGKEIPTDAEKKSKDAEKAHARARTLVNKEREKIKKEKLKGEDRKKAVEERVVPLETDAHGKRGQWLTALRDAVPRPELALGARIDCTAGEYRNHAADFTQGGDSASREATQYLAAFGTDACLDDGKGPLQERKIEATPFCFIRGSGHQDFLVTVRNLLAKVTNERIEQTLFEPWVYRDQGLSMRWDPIEDRRYALMDRDPTASDNKARTVWMANLLAYRALALFLCTPTRRGLGTTAWADVENEQVFTWPIWEFAASLDTVRTMLQLRELRGTRLDRGGLRARGIAEVYRARRIRVEKYLNFTPACGIL